METSSNRKLLIAVGAVLFFAIIVIVWYFFYAKPIVAPTLNQTNDPVKQNSSPPRFQFLQLWGGDRAASSTTEVVSGVRKPLVQIWDKPATGQTFITTDVLKDITATSTSGSSTVEVKKSIRATSTVLLFVDRITGYVYGHTIETGTTYQISNTLIPGVYDAYFFNNGSHVLLRYIDPEKNTVVGVIANVPRVSEGGTALSLENTQYLTSEVISIAVNKKGDRAAYVVATENGSAIYTVTNKTPVLVANSPFRELLVSYSEDSIFVTTKPSAYIPGSTFSVPLFQSELSEKTGLMSNPGGSRLFINSMWGTKGLVTFLSQAGKVSILSIKTLASKCAWGDDNFLLCAVPQTLDRGPEGLPDDWYQGSVSFNDDLVFVDKTTSQVYPIYSFNNNEGVFDIDSMSIASGNDLVSFTRRNDKTLWLLTRSLTNFEEQ